MTEERLHPMVDAAGCVVGGTMGGTTSVEEVAVTC